MLLIQHVSCNKNNSRAFCEGIQSWCIALLIQTASLSSQVQQFVLLISLSKSVRIYIEFPPISNSSTKHVFSYQKILFNNDNSNIIVLLNNLM